MAHEEPFVPLYSQTQVKLKNQHCNFSLYSPRMVPWKFSGKELKVDENALRGLYDQSEKSFSAAKELLRVKKSHLQDYAEALAAQGIKTFTFKAKTASPFITGLASGHPTETGMVLDRNLGIPYIPASSIKGVLRLAHAINIADGRANVPDSELARYFGTTDIQKKQGVAESRGQLMLLDAYPSDSVQLHLDIMNSHFGKYYNGENKQPIETESPNPIRFLTISEGTVFTFYCAFMSLAGERCTTDDEVAINAMFKTAFETIGFGGKTSIGYGRFKIN